MKFGETPVAGAVGQILAHSLRLPGGAIKKGRALTAEDLALLSEAGIGSVVTARLDVSDIAEDEAAAAIAARIHPQDQALICLSAPFTGRVNLFAEVPGVLQIDAAGVERLNRIDEAITLATLPAFARVHPRQMLATVKIIPYAAPREAVEAAVAMLGDAGVLRLHPFRPLSASLILTRTPGMADKLVEKGTSAVRDRLTALGASLESEIVVPHETGAVAEAIAGASGEIVLILTASATSDRADIGPAGLVAAGGRLGRFGMPVDPGNLLFLGEQGGRPVLGLPGCARSPKLNGADWVLERLVAGLEVSATDIAAMGVGGLLKEIPSRPNPRAGAEALHRRPKIAAMILAAGQSNRMGARDKLIEPVADRPLLTRIAEQAIASAADEVIAVLGADPQTDPRTEARARALETLELRQISNPQAHAGMGTSIAAGVRALDPEADGVLILMGDMPEITAADLDRLIAAFDPAEGRLIVRATSEDGRPGHPVLFGRRFFELLAGLEGDRGARAIVEEHREFITDIRLEGRRALVDLDTPEAWEAWRASR